MVIKDKLVLKTQEGAQIKIGMEVDDVEIRAVTGGIIEAAGIAKNQVIVINTGGVFEGRELKTSTTSVKISAGGEALLSASERVDINVRAGGRIYIKD